MTVSGSNIPQGANAGDAGGQAAAADLQRRRQDIERGLQRSRYAVLAVIILVGLFALAALWFGFEARRSAQEALHSQQVAESRAKEAHRAGTNLWAFSARAAHQQRMSRKVGQRAATLDLIRQAAQFQPSRELRDEALSALLLPDFGTNQVWHRETSYEFAAVYDSTFENFIQNSDAGRAIVRRAADGAVLMDEKGLGGSTPYRQFSPDGRLAAVAFRGGMIGVWDWKTTNCLLKAQAIDGSFDEPTFGFSADGRRLWYLAANQTLRDINLVTRQEGAPITVGEGARVVMISRSGRLAAVGRKGSISVIDLDRRQSRASLAVEGRVHRLAWHPDEERVAFSCEEGLFLWENGSDAAIRLRAGGFVRYFFFSPDGSWIFNSGDSLTGQFLRLGDGQVLLETEESTVQQIIRDSTRLAVVDFRIGYGLRQFLPPVGLHDWLPAVSLGVARQRADVDPRERWILSVYASGFVVRDAETGRSLVQVTNKNMLNACFAADGESVLGWFAGGLSRWPLSIGAAGGNVTLGSPKTVWLPPEAPLEFGVFSDDRQHAACGRRGRVTIFDLENPVKTVEFGLRRPADNGLLLSPDGRWFFSDHHLQRGLDWYDGRSGRWLREIASDGFVSGVSFWPPRGHLLTCTSTEFSEWGLEDGRLLSATPWRLPMSYQDFLGIRDDGRFSVVKATASSFRLFDLQTRRDFATLDFRDSQAVFKAHWSRQGERLLLFFNNGTVTRIDLGVLRGGLAALGLNWPEDAPGRDFPAATNPLEVSASRENTVTFNRAQGSGIEWLESQQPVWAIAAGFIIAMGIGYYILRYQRNLFDGYRDTQTVAEERAGQLRETHAALAHSEKMKALGTLAAGVAHDFNNLLSVIRLSSELIEEQATTGSVVHENFLAIQNAVQRGRGIVNSMLGYARDDGEVRTFPPHALITDAVGLLSKPFLSGLDLQLEIDPSTPELAGRRGRIEQMLLNLIVNAAEAMGGRGTLCLGARPANDAAGCVLPPRAARRYVELRVADSGPGIPPEVLSRIFEPFFTTKARGSQQGTGLGLSMLYAMAREDGVGVAVDSAPGRGATFRLFLPADAGVSGDSAAATGTSERVGTSRPLPDLSSNQHGQT